MPVGRVTPDEGLRVRTGPATENGILGTLEKDEEVVLIAMVGEWWGVDSRFGFGFAHGAFIEVLTAGPGARSRASCNRRVKVL